MRARDHYCLVTWQQCQKLRIKSVLFFSTGAVFLFPPALASVQWKRHRYIHTHHTPRWAPQNRAHRPLQNDVWLLPKMKWLTADYFEKQNEERGEEVSGEGEPTRGDDSDTTDDGSAAGRERATEQEKKKKYLWLWYEGNAMLCEYYRQCGPCIAGSSKLVTGSPLFRLKILKLHNNSDWCMTGNTELLLTSFQQLDESNFSTEENEMVIKFNTAYNSKKSNSCSQNSNPRAHWWRKTGWMWIQLTQMRNIRQPQRKDSWYLSFIIDGDKDVLI